MALIYSIARSHPVMPAKAGVRFFQRTFDTLLKDAFRRHSGKSQNPVKTLGYKIPAFAGMTEKGVSRISRQIAGFLFVRE